jgi:penicillin G amidase
MVSEDLCKALPKLDGVLKIPGLKGNVDVWRDPQGVPHIKSESVHDAFFAQGFVHAQDRLWQMEYDRRRACGRWAEYAGLSGLAQDKQMRRFRLEESARLDYREISAETRAMLDSYAAGVNAFISLKQFPIEFRLVDSSPEPWNPWDSILVFKVRHIMMGHWQNKTWRARQIKHLGAMTTERLIPGIQPHSQLIVPPGAEYEGPAFDAVKELTEGEAIIPHLPEWENGSNNWALHGSRTASGKPLLAGDPHRPLEAPAAYYPNHLASPEFDVIGFSFAGIPGFSHFGHNAHVAWCLTHGTADYQDLFIERFDPRISSRYEFKGEWRDADVRSEQILVRGSKSVELETTATHHGPVVLGEPKTGYAFSFRYTSTARPNHTFETILPMMCARSAEGLYRAQKTWVDPVQNFVFADVEGHIGYVTRGELPKRPKANVWLPVPGWDGKHEWTGYVPFEEMPSLRDPEAKFIVTANSCITGSKYPHHISSQFNDDFRTRRIVERLSKLERATVADMEDIHRDRTSIPAQQLVQYMREMEIFKTRLESNSHPTCQILKMLFEWNGSMDLDSEAAVIYTVLRDLLIRELVNPILGPLREEAFSGAPGAAGGNMARLRNRLPEMMLQDNRTLLPNGKSWPDILVQTVDQLILLLPDPKLSWGDVHILSPRHTLSLSQPSLAPLLDPPSSRCGGDADTVQASSYPCGPRLDASNGDIAAQLAKLYSVNSTSVTRYVFDLSDWEKCGWVIALGVSGHPGSPHYADQREAWSKGSLFPMRFSWSRIQKESISRQSLIPLVS